MRYARQPLFKAALAAGIALLAALLQPLAAQAPREIGRLAAQTAKRITKTYAHRFLITPLASCHGGQEICVQLDQALRAELVKAIPGAQFIERDEAVQHLADQGFLSIDAYLGALDSVAAAAGAEVVISVERRSAGNKCELHTGVTDAKYRFVLDDFRVRFSCDAAAKTMPVILKDARTGTAILVAAPRPQEAPQGPGLSKFRPPTCVSCPNPRYSGFARQQRIQGRVRILATVTEQGTVENARVLSNVEEGLGRVSLEAVNGWQFKPAIGADGNPLSFRTKVEVMFRLMPR